MIADLWPQLEVLARQVLEIAFRQAIYVGCVGLVIVVATTALAGRWPALRHGLWSLVVLRLLLPVDLAAPWSMRAWLEAGASAIGAEALLPVTPTAEVALVHTVDQVPIAGAGAMPVPWALSLVALWLLTTVWVARRMLRARRAYRAVLARGEPASMSVRVIAERWRRRLGIRRPVQVVTTDADVAFTVGVLRPRIALPRVIVDNPRPDLCEAVVAHEMAHVERFDDAWVLLQMTGCVLQPWHPMTWVAARAMSEAREEACDARAVTAGGLTPEALARALVTLARPGGSHTVAAFARTARRLTMRINRMLKDTHRLESTFVRRLAWMFAAVALLPMAAQVQGDPPPAETTRASTGGAPPMAVVTFTNPVPGGRVSSGFGMRRHPMSGERLKHRGTDVVAQRGTALLAPADGLVELATTRYSGGDTYGTVVVLDHGGGTKTFFSHLERLDVATGDRVVAGERVGTMGDTGEVTGVHVHFEVWQHGEPVDPGAFVTAWKGKKQD